MQTMVTRFGTFPAPVDDVASEPDAATMDATRQTRVAPAVALSSLPAVDPAGASDVDEVRYQLGTLLGRGGMGEVRLCHDRRIGRDVAVKLMLSRATDTAVRARFLREARVQGQLEHPAIVPVHDLEVFPDGSAYFAIKRVRGRTLADILGALRRGDDETARAFPQRKLLAAFNAVCLAVDFAHEKRVMHRDIKPANIMLGDFGEVYLLDWGLAKLLEHDDEEPAGAVVAPAGAADATIAGSMLGTPGYMAPEQIDASIAPIGPATDVYALGAVLFEILSLQRHVEAKAALTHPDTEAGRSAALRELGRAVAIDADNTEARRALVRLLTTPPTVTPPAVRQRIRDEEPARVRELARMLAISLLPFAPLVPVGVWIGVREPLLFWSCAIGLTAVAPALNIVLARSRSPKAWLQALAHIVFLASVAGFARAAGPLLLLPAALAAYSVQLQLHPRPRYRGAVFAACCITFMAACGLEFSGLIEPSYTITSDGMLIHAHMHELPVAAPWFFALCSLVTVVSPSVFAYRARAALAVAEERLHLQAWQLAQIVPSESSQH
ncbi:MAG: hypothetical protein A2138_08000 [Deltaproteobacteria bacterium RBG_16_71_12]|nr:MAG: hypothetical protein A2138_08000 [Deltaproteobacteria bacterium RBG_16_71_12]